MDEEVPQEEITGTVEVVPEVNDENKDTDSQEGVSEVESSRGFPERMAQRVMHTPEPIGVDPISQVTPPNVFMVDQPVDADRQIRSGARPRQPRVLFRSSWIPGTPEDTDFRTISRRVKIKNQVMLNELRDVHSLNLRYREIIKALVVDLKL